MSILAFVIVQRITEPVIAQCAYFVACSRTRHAILVDPVRDTLRYLQIAREQSFTIMGVLETHAPSDYVSGVYEMLTASSALGYLSGETEPPAWFTHDRSRWQRRVQFLKDGSTLAIGDLQARAILTPGHAKGALSIFIEDPASAVRVVLTGDALLPGGAGRTSAADTEQLRDSLRRLTALPDETIILAGHVGGSACVRAVDLPGETNMGIERRFNSALRTLESPSDFAQATCGSQPERPAYFSRVERLNSKEHMPLLDELSVPKQLDVDTFLQFVSLPATVVVDTRPWDQFTLDGAEGALHAPFDRFFAPMIAGAIASDERVVCVCDPSQVVDITRALRLIGIDRIIGWISTAQYAQIDREVMPLSEVDEISQHAAHAMYQRAECLMIDVRTTAEWMRGRVLLARLMTMSQIADQIDEIPRDRFVIAYCRSGGRSARACAFLRRKGIRCATLQGGFWPWFGRGFPVEGVSL